MPQQRYDVGDRLNETTALQLAADLSLVDATESVAVDFSAISHFEPFGMLITSSAINRLRRRLSLVHAELNCITGAQSGDDIAGHMGFWRSIGVPFGRDVGAAAGNESYLPITKIDVAETYQRLGGADPLASGFIEDEALRLATILATPRSRELLDALTYALRELIRNVFEHAQTPALWLAGMSWPKRDYVQVAVLDEGVGIRKSLSRNPTYKYQTDIEAIRAAVQPGITRSLNLEPSRERLERWAEERHDRPIGLFQNSGYGLHVISSLCRESGQFLIASGSSALGYVGGGEIQTATAHQGTALRLVFRPSEIDQAMSAVFSGNFVRGPAGRKPMVSASTLKRLGLDSLTGGSAENK